MAGTNFTNLLDIPIVGVGFYRGFNAIVAVTTKLLVMGLVAFLIAMPTASSHVLTTLKTATLTVFAGWYIYLLAAFVVFNLVLVVLPVSGRVTLGSPSLPETHPTLQIQPRCLGFGGSRVDAAIASEILRVVEPMAAVRACRAESRCPDTVPRMSASIL